MTDPLLSPGERTKPSVRSQLRDLVFPLPRPGRVQSIALAIASLAGGGILFSRSIYGLYLLLAILVVLGPGRWWLWGALALVVPALRIGLEGGPQLMMLLPLALYLVPTTIVFLIPAKRIRAGKLSSLASGVLAFPVLLLVTSVMPGMYFKVTWAQIQTYRLCQYAQPGTDPRDVEKQAASLGLHVYRSRHMNGQASDAGERGRIMAWESWGLSRCYCNVEYDKTGVLNAKTSALD